MQGRGAAQPREGVGRAPLYQGRGARPADPCGASPLEGVGFARLFAGPAPRNYQNIGYPAASCAARSSSQSATISSVESWLPVCGSSIAAW